MPTSATQGYAVPEKVPVASGTVDAVVSREGDRVVIEVGGEDQGGYGSADKPPTVALTAGARWEWRRARQAERVTGTA
jgi:hypothetical protein